MSRINVNRMLDRGSTSSENSGPILFESSGGNNKNRKNADIPLRLDKLSVISGSRGGEVTRSLKLRDNHKKRYLMSLLAQLETQKGALKDKAIITIKKIAQPEAVI